MFYKGRRTFTVWQWSSGYGTCCRRRRPTASPSSPAQWTRAYGSRTGQTSRLHPEEPHPDKILLQTKWAPPRAPTATSSSSNFSKALSRQASMTTVTIPQKSLLCTCSIVVGLQGYRGTTGVGYLEKLAVPRNVLHVHDLAPQMKRQLHRPDENFCPDATSYLIPASHRNVAGCADG